MVLLSFKKKFLKCKSEAERIAKDWNMENRTRNEIEKVVNRLKEQVNNRSALVEELEVRILRETSC